MQTIYSKRLSVAPHAKTTFLLFYQEVTLIISKQKDNEVDSWNVICHDGEFISHQYAVFTLIIKGGIRIGKIHLL